jgi:hypothetical protein
MKKEFLKNLAGIECPSIEDILNENHEIRGLLISEGSALEYAQIGKDFSVRSIKKVVSFDFPKESVNSVCESGGDIFFSVNDHDEHRVVRLSDMREFGFYEPVLGLASCNGAAVVCTKSLIFSISEDKVISRAEDAGYICFWGIRSCGDSLYAFAERGAGKSSLLKIRNGTISGMMAVNESTRGNYRFPFDVFDAWNLEEDAECEILKTKTASNFGDISLYIDRRKVLGELNEFGYISDIRTASVDLHSNIARFFMCENSQVQIAEISVSGGKMIDRKSIFSAENRYFTLKAEVIKSRAAENLLLNYKEKSKP